MSDLKSEPSVSSDNSLGPLLMQLLIGCIVLGFGAYAAYYLFSHVEKPTRVEKPRQARLVSTFTVQEKQFQIEIEAMGTVLAARESMLQMETSGKVVAVSEQIFPGSLIRAGEELISIDKRNYLRILEQQKAVLAAREAELAIELGNAAIAVKEFSLVGLEIKPEERALVLREPQLATVRAEVAAAKAAVEQAEIDLQRTVLRAPYDCIILEKNTDLGENVNAGSDLLHVIGSEFFWVESFVSERDLPWLISESAAEPLRVKVSNTSMWGDKSREGQMLRVLPVLEKDGRLARVLCSIADPLDQAQAGLPHVRIGSFVKTTFLGPQYEAAIVLPTSMLHDGDVVWVVKEKTLEIRSVEIAWRNQELVLIKSGLNAGERLITTPLNAVVNGMAVRLENEKSESVEKSISATAGAE